MVPGIGNSWHGRKFGQGEEKKIPYFRCLTLRSKAKRLANGYRIFTDEDISQINEAWENYKNI